MISKQGGKTNFAKMVAKSTANDLWIFANRPRLKPYHQKIVCLFLRKGGGGSQFGLVPPNLSLLFFGGFPKIAQFFFLGPLNLQEKFPKGQGRRQELHENCGKPARRGSRRRKKGCNERVTRLQTQTTQTHANKRATSDKPSKMQSGALQGGHA